MGCQHISKSIDLPTFMLSLMKNSILTDCKKCQNTAEKQKKEKTMWMCFKCGNQACGRQNGRHALEHYKAERNSSHCLALNMNTWEIWCYECEKYVSIQCNQFLLESVKVVQQIKCKLPSADVDDNEETAVDLLIFQLKGMAPHQRHIAVKLISDIMYYGGMGKLSDFSKLSNA